MEQKKDPCGSDNSGMSLADKIKFISLVDKGSSPVGFKKSLGMNPEDIKMHLARLPEYREQVSIFNRLMDLMKARKTAETIQERKTIQAKIREVQEELNSYGKEKAAEDSGEQSS